MARFAHIAMPCTSTPDGLQLWEADVLEYRPQLAAELCGQPGVVYRFSGHEHLWALCERHRRRVDHLALEVVRVVDA